MSKGPLPNLDELFGTQSSGSSISNNVSTGLSNSSASNNIPNGIGSNVPSSQMGVNDMDLNFADDQINNPHMKAILELVNKLQYACAVAGDVRGAGEGGSSDLPSLWDALPSMVVVGGQSSGKSSVLESIVGRDFLPRGSGIVTRRPLVLQLIYSANTTEYGEFSHKLGKKYTNYDEIRNEIEAETARSLGSGKAISPIPINLTIHSPNVPNLTLVDMPGLTKIPIAGQPASIVKDIEDMARKFVESKNVIILAVSPANADLATSDAIRLASEVDPQGERTLGVLTKIDIMDRGTDALSILQGETFSLKNGWVGVVNRSQHDINSNLSMERARKQEMDFFKQNHIYSSLRNVGTSFLASKCASYLQKALQKQLPNIQEFLDRSISKINSDLLELGGEIDGTRGSMLHKILSMCHDFENSFVKSLESGKGGGESILTVFEVKLKRGIRTLPVTTTGIFAPEKVSRVILESDGYQPHLIAPEQGYRTLIGQGLDLAKSPALSTVDEVHIILRSITESTLRASHDLARFNNLKEEIKVETLRALDELRNDSRKMVQTMVEMESSYLTASYFKKILQESQNNKPLNTTPNGPSNPNNERLQEFQKIGGQVAAYVQHVLQVLETTIPKAIVHCQIIKAKDHLLKTLEQKLADKDMSSLTNLLSEDEEITKKRQQLSKRLNLLIESKAEVAKVL